MSILADILHAPFAKPHFPSSLGLEFHGIERDQDEVIVKLTDPSNGHNNVSFGMDAQKRTFAVPHPNYAPHLDLYGPDPSTSGDIILIPLFVALCPLNIAGALVRSALSHWSGIHFEGHILMRELKERLDPETMELLKDCLEDSWRHRGEISKASDEL